MKHIKKFEQIKWEFDDEEENIENETDEIKIGSVVKFKKIKNGCIYDFHGKHYLNDYLKHGSTSIYENRGIVKNIVNHNNRKYYMVEYIDIYLNNVQLGFDIDDLELKKIIK